MDRMEIGDSRYSISYLRAGIYDIIYDGTYYRIIGGHNYNSTYSGYVLSPNTDNKIYLIGRPVQNSNPSTPYSHDTVYVGTDGCLYSDSTKVSVEGHTHSVTYTAEISTAWTGSEAPYTQTIIVSGITETDNPIVDVLLSGTYDIDEAMLVEYAKIYRITTAADTITVYASEPTESNIDIQLKCIED